MMRWTAAVAVLGASLLFTAPAAAGTYEVVSCGAPGAGGVNRAWGAKVDVPGIYEDADCRFELFAAGSAAPTGLRVTSARAVRRGGRGRRLKVRGGRVKVPNGRAVRVRGHLSLIRGASVGGVEVLATTSVVRGRSARPAGRVVTSRSGRFSLRLPAGPSRVLQLSSPGSGAALGATGRLSVRVPGKYPIRALIRRQGSFPFEAGHSRAVRVRIR